ncbi:MAG: hypothetical protein JWQ38_3199 [Flavipsychrobacter sp.]|nr:hypothetical protein [Flavipsychrobacter sp.]
MPCNHKFQNELNLELIDYEPTTLIVGSFNPGPPVNNTAGWFYGRTASNYFWDALPRLYGEESLINATPAEWKQFCRDKQIAITDLISSIDDAEPESREHQKILAGFSDDAIAYHFEDFTFVNIAQLLQRHPTIKNIYITRGTTEAFWRHLWNPITQYCNRNNIREGKLLTPSGDDTIYQHGAYNEQHPDKQVPLPQDYILMRWKQEWHF